MIASFFVSMLSVRMKRSANTTATSVKTPMTDRMKTLIAIGEIRAVMPMMMHASTTTVPSRSPIAMSPWPLRTL